MSSRCLSLPPNNNLHRSLTHLTPLLTKTPSLSPDLPPTLGRSTMGLAGRVVGGKKGFYQMFSPRDPHTLNSSYTELPRVGRHVRTRNQPQRYNKKSKSTPVCSNLNSRLLALHKNKHPYLCQQDLTTNQCNSQTIIRYLTHHKGCSIQ